MICAGTCKYRGPCTGDDALALLFSGTNEDGQNMGDVFEVFRNPTCASLPEMEAMIMTMKGMAGQPGVTIDVAAMDDVDAKLEIGKDICGTSSRARKLTDAPRMDASKAHQAAAMLRSIKTTAHRLAQVRGLGQ